MGQQPAEHAHEESHDKSTPAQPGWMMAAKVTAVVLAILAAMATWQAVRWSREAARVGRDAQATDTRIAMPGVMSAGVHTQGTFQKSAALFAISFVIVAASLAARRKEIWFFSLLGALAGLLYLNSAFLHAPAPAGANETKPAERY
jgi:hypothetical protein